jgi:hypothetical protein
VHVYGGDEMPTARAGARGGVVLLESCSECGAHEYVFWGPAIALFLKSPDR